MSDRHRCRPSSGRRNGAGAEDDRQGGGPQDHPVAMSPGRARIEIPHERIADFCRRRHIRWLALFGSVLRDDFRPDSDVDILVEFEPGTRLGFAFVDVQEELSQIIGRRVDLRTPRELSKYFRDEVLAEAEDVYVAA